MHAHFTRLQSTTLFNESIKSKYTKKNYTSHLNQFKRFAKITSTDKIVTLPQEELQIILENYVMELRRTANPNSIPSKFQGIRHFCVMNRICVDWDIIHKMFPQRQRAPILRAYTADEIREMLSAVNARDAALIHFLASTGARIGVFDHSLVLGHLKKMPCRCKAVKLYAGEVEEYWAFLTPQASKILDVYHNMRRNGGEAFDEDTPVFAVRNAHAGQLTWNGARSALYRIIAKNNIPRTKHDGRYDVQADHGFRKRFNTILKLDNSVNYNIAEKLMGHKNGLDGAYFVPTIEEMFAEFRKIICKLQV